MILPQNVIFAILVCVIIAKHNEFSVLGSPIVVFHIRQQDINPVFVCLFAWGLTALSAQIGYIVP